MHRIQKFKFNPLQYMKLSNYSHKKKKNTSYTKKTYQICQLFVRFLRIVGFPLKFLGKPLGMQSQSKKLWRDHLGAKA